MAPAHRLRIEYVDGLRAVAVLSVLIAHIGAHTPGLGSVRRHVMLEGSHGVDLFFVISGFCLALPTLARWKADGAARFDVADFGAKRLVRIVPPFYLATAFFVILALLARTAGHGSGLTLPGPLELAASLLFIDGRVQLINSSFWTLMVEFRWYLLFPVLLYVWLRSPRMFAAIGLGCALLYALTRARGLDLGTLPGFMLGIVAADIAVGARLDESIRTPLQRYALPLAALCIAGGVATERNATIPGFYGADVAWPFQPTIPGWQLGCFFAVVAAGATPFVTRLLASPPLVAVGIASYSIYLMHEPLIAAVVARRADALGMAAAFVVAIGMGFAFWWAAERPFTDGTLRKRLLAPAGALMRSLFQWLRWPAVIRVGA